MEAMKFGAIPKRIENPLKLPFKKEENNHETLSRKHKSSIEQANAMNEMKLKVLENWEITKRKAIERLAEEIEELQQIEERIEQREKDLLNRGIKIDESVFRNFCDESQPLNMSLQKSPTLMCSPSTEGRKQQKPLMHSTPNTIKKSKNSAPTLKIQDHQLDEEDHEGMVVIGPNGTKVARKALSSINWNLSGAAITRKILMEVFDRETLAFHTLTGKPSPAFMDCDKPLKNQLDPFKVADIIHIITKNLQMTPKEVRSAITTKCADENKMYRQREKKRLCQAEKSSDEILKKQRLDEATH